MRSTPEPQAATAAAAKGDAEGRAEVEALIRDLEGRAMAAHAEAQALNKAQRFEEAKAKYDEMRRLDAKALRLANSLGCPSCRSNQSGAAGGAAAAPAAAAPEYATLQRVTPWPGPDPAAVADAAFGAVLGAGVADAAATSVQWIYDLATLEQLLSNRRAREGPGAHLDFLDPPASPFLPGYEVGRSSPYGEGASATLRALAGSGGFDAAAYARVLLEAFGEGFDGYRNASITGFLRNYGRGAAPPATGAEDAQADCVTRLPPLVAAFAGHDNLMRMVAAATRTTQNTDDAEAWACAGAAVLEALVLGGATVAEAVERAAAELRAGSGRLPASPRLAAISGHLKQALDLRAAPPSGVIEQLGRNCHMPNAAVTPIHVALHAEWRLEQSGARTAPAADVAFAEAVRGALAGGGCCASRAGFAGACLGARLGPGAVPAAWRAKALCAGEVEGLFAQLRAARGGG